MFRAQRAAVAALGLSVCLTTPARLTAQPQASATPCVGDCNASGTVTVAELLLMVNISFETAPMTACPAADATGDGRVTVNELLMAVNNILYGCGVLPTATPSRTASPTPSATPSATPKPIPTAAVEPASGVALSTLTALTLIVTGLPAGSGASALAPPLSGVLGTRPLALAGAGAFASGTGHAATTVPCDSGSMDVSCSESGSSSTLTTVLYNCRLVDPTSGDSMTANGNMTITVAARGVCATGVIPDNVMVATHYRSFSSTTTDSHGAVIETVSFSEMTETVVPTGQQGCAGADGTLTENGSFSMAAPGISANLSGSATNLALQVTSTGSPCTMYVIATGGLALTDQAANRRFTVSAFQGAGATLTPQSDDSLLATLAGTLATDCVGTVTLQTTTALHLVGAPCPTAGVLWVTRADGTNGRITFTAGGGMAFDYTGDGLTERTVASCRDPSVAQCH
jgi:hypothetical protein